MYYVLISCNVLCTVILTCAVAFAVYWTRPNDIGSRSGGKKITTPKTMPKLESGASSGMTARDVETCGEPRNPTTTTTTPYTTIRDSRKTAVGEHLYNMKSRTLRATVVERGRRRRAWTRERREFYRAHCPVFPTAAAAVDFSAQTIL